MLCTVHDITSQSKPLPLSFYSIQLNAYVALRNLKHCLALANIVADSRYKLYDDFVNQDGRRLGDYLQAVRRAVLAGLEGGGSDPFWIVTSA